MSLIQKMKKPERLSVKLYPDPVLFEKAQNIKEITEYHISLVKQMFKLMHHKNGVGLAASQVGIPINMFVCADVRDRSDYKKILDFRHLETKKDSLRPIKLNKKQIVIFNPKIVESEGIETSEEGCLSLPGVYDTVERSTWIKVKGLGLEGETVELEVQKLLAAIFQHEIDHLNGTLFIDRLSLKQRFSIMGQLDKLRSSWNEKQK